MQCLLLVFCHVASLVHVPVMFALMVTVYQTIMAALCP